MTDDRNTPEENELADEQLDDVAGGSDAIQDVSNVSGPRSVAAQGPEQPGELSRYDDATTPTRTPIVKAPISTMMRR